MDRARVLIEDPCPFCLPEILTVAHMSAGRGRGEDGLAPSEHIASSYRLFLR